MVMGMNDKSMKKPDEMRAEYRCEDLGKDIRGKHNAVLEGKSKLPRMPKRHSPLSCGFCWTPERRLSGNHGR